MRDTMQDPVHTVTADPTYQSRTFAYRDRSTEIARLAIDSLHSELKLAPKPGLVTPFDNGSHHDMTAQTFLRSLFALRHYFKKIAAAGAAHADFATLRQLGIEAEQVMLIATGGINTHRGAIFTLGLLSATIGAMTSLQPVTAVAIQQSLQRHWGSALQRHAAACNGDSHGLVVARRYALDGAREQAAQGFPAVFEIGLPQLQASLRAGRGWRAACIDCLFALMAQLSDSNVAHRGGLAGAQTVRRLAADFMQAGGTAADDWELRATACGKQFTAANLSPGGAADLLAATMLVYRSVHGQ